MKLRNGFTLIELLVVIAIISLLISILAPSLTEAKYLARQAACAVNLRNLVTAMSTYAAEADGVYLRTSGPDTAESCWSSWGTYGCVTSWNTGGKKLPVGYGLLLKHQYVPSVMQLHCPGRGKAWPGQDIFAYPDEAIADHDGELYPWRVSYNLRGWQGHQKYWCTPSLGRIAVNADMILNIRTAVDAHQGNGINVGYSDGSAVFIPGDTDFNADHSFFDYVELYPTSGNTFSFPARHHQYYRFYDRQG